MRTPLALLLVTAVASATETVSFKLPDAGGEFHSIPDLKSRYLLIVYQGIP
ncbi:MAG: hypothetical protein ACYTGZ_20785 [Planctomycetota bacterium]|jgi:hypothetical protein